MKITQKIFAGLGVAALTVAAVYPHVDRYIKSLPQHMTVEQAGQRYLEAVCPANRINDEGEALDKKLKEEYNKTYYVGSVEMQNANARIGALRNNIFSLSHRAKDAAVRESRFLTDPKFIWPENVRKDVEAQADESFRYAGWVDAQIKKGLTGEEEFKSGNFADTIRRKLNLPVRGTGCSAQQVAQ